MHYSREARLTIPVHAEPGGGTKLGAGENMAVEGHGKTHCGPNDTEKKFMCFDTAQLSLYGRKVDF